MKQKCKHNWVLLLPVSSKTNLPEDKKLDYAVEVMLSGILMQRSVFCTECGRTGHRINSSRGGIRLHGTDYFLNAANNILKKHGIPEHTLFNNKPI